MTFLPSSQIFTKTEFDFEELEHRLRELAFLNAGLHITLRDERAAEPRLTTFHYEGGIEAFVGYLDRAKQSLVGNAIMIRDRRGDIIVDAALQWNDSYHETVLCFTNNIRQSDGGSHLAGLRAALTRAVNGYAAQSGIAKREKVSITGDDAREGAHLRPLGQGARSEILLPDQGEAGQLRGQAGGGGHRRRGARPVVGGAPDRGPRGSSPRRSRPRRRGRPRGKPAT